MMFKSITEKMIKLFRYAQNKAEKIQWCSLCNSYECIGECNV